MDEKIVKDSQGLAKELVNDCISRQAAIDALHAHLMYRMGTESNKKRLDEWINSLPSAQPKTHDKRTETHACDLIDRAEAIDATWFEPSYTDPLNVLTEVRDRLKVLPSAQPEQQWILCSERLPKDFEDVLVWYEYFKYGEYNRMVQTWDVGYYISEFNRWGGGVTGQKVRAIAWMPLPEPYKEDDHETD